MPYSDHLEFDGKTERASIVHWYPRLMRSAAHWLPQVLRDRFSVEDFVQETLMIGLVQWEKTAGRSESEIEAWLLSILRNRIRMEARRAFRKLGEEPIHRERNCDMEFLDGFCDSPTDDDAIVLIHRENIEHLRSRIESLPEEMQAIIRWRFFDELHYEVIGERLQISSRQARRRVRVAMDRIVSQFDIHDRNGI